MKLNEFYINKTTMEKCKLTYVSKRNVIIEYDVGILGISEETMNKDYFFDTHVLQEALNG